MNFISALSLESDYTLCITEPDFGGIIGLSGGGKTIFLKMILGLLTPDRNSVRLFADDERIRQRKTHT